MNQFLNTAIDIKQVSWPAHNALPACTGACGQGRHACATPDRCMTGVTDDGEPLEDAEAVRVYAVILGVPAVVVVLGLLAAFWG